MPNAMTQIKFTIDIDTVSAFKARCANEGVSMTSVIRQLMKTCQPTRDAKTKMSSRPLRKKAVSEIVGMLNGILDMEELYRANIPEQFAQRHEAADHSCEQLSEAIACLEDAF